MNFDEAHFLLGQERNRLRDAVERALLLESTAAAAVHSPPVNARAYRCSVAGCARPAYALGFCNAHYIRHRKGKDMTAPVRARKRDGACSECGKLCGPKGGWGLCPAHYRLRRRAVIKRALVEAMGGSCQKCGGKFHTAAYDFHHFNPRNKRGAPSQLLADAAVEAIAAEVASCVLLCANCHRVEHANEF